MLERLFAWAGGALFVASLVFCAYTYVFVWSDAAPNLPATHGPLADVVIDVGLVGVFALHHSLLARDAVKRRVTSLVPERLLRPLYVWIASLLFILVCAVWRPIGGELFAATGLAAAVLTALQVIGVAVIAWSVACIDALELAGIRRLMATHEKPVTDTPLHTLLQTGGPYRLVRHPLYLGWIVAAFCAAHLTVDRLAFAVITTAYLVIAVPWEERALEREFPGEYGRYRRQVRWRVIPYVY